MPTKSDLGGGLARDHNEPIGATEVSASATARRSHAQVTPLTPRAPGRPRDESRTRDILDAVMAIIAEVGYERMRVQDVTERAGVSLATIYRRWPTKTALVVAAVEDDSAPMVLADSGHVERDIDSILAELAVKLTKPEFTRIALLATLADEPEIMAAVQRNQISALRNHMRAVLARVLGADHPDLALLADVGPGLIWYRMIMVGDGLDPASLAASVTELILNCLKEAADRRPLPVTPAAQ